MVRRAFEEGIRVIRTSTAGAAIAVCLLALAGCDNTYTPSAHHQAEASTGSLLSGTDTGANGNGGTNDPSIRGNAGGPASYGGH